MVWKEQWWWSPPRTCAKKARWRRHKWRHLMKRFHFYVMMICSSVKNYHGKSAAKLLRASMWQWVMFPGRKNLSRLDSPKGQEFPWFLPAAMAVYHCWMVRNGSFTHGITHSMTGMYQIVEVLVTSYDWCSGYNSGLSLQPRARHGLRRGSCATAIWALLAGRQVATCQRKPRWRTR